MIGLLLTLVQAGAAAPASPQWTWSLYEDAEQISFAREVPDTDRLDAVLECVPKSGRVSLTLYDLTASAPTGTARLRAGLFLGGAPYDSGESLGEPWVKISAATRHGVLQRFWRGARLSVAVGGVDRTLTVDPAARPQLARFAALCG